MLAESGEEEEEKEMKSPFPPYRCLSTVRLSFAANIALLGQSSYSASRFGRLELRLAEQHSYDIF